MELHRRKAKVEEGNEKEGREGEGRRKSSQNPRAQEKKEGGAARTVDPRRLFFTPFQTSRIVKKVTRREKREREYSRIYRNVHDEIQAERETDDIEPRPDVG